MTDEQKKDGAQIHLSRILGGMADAQSSENPNFYKFQQFFSKPANIRAEYVDLFLEEFLFKTLALPPNETERQHTLLSSSEASLFGNDNTFIKKVINRIISLTENKENVGRALAYICQKFNKMRTSSKFVEYLMRSVEANQAVHFIEPQLRECLAEAFLKMPLSQSLIMGTTMCDVISSEQEQFKAEGKGTVHH